MEIKTDMNLQMKNVISFRGKFDQKGLIDKKQEIDDIIKQLGVHPIHSAITTTFGAVKTDEGQKMDMEILIPVDRDISHEVAMMKKEGLRFKPKFQLTNAVCIRHVGSEDKIGDSLKELKKFMEVRNMRPITTGYNIPQNDPEKPDEFIMDIMIGIDPNIL